jgi:hypothetical protein
MADLDFELQFVHVADSGSLEDDFRLEIARVIRMANKCFHLASQKFNIFERSVERDVHIELLFHGLGAGDVFDPQVVEDYVGHLYHFHGIDAFEDCEEEGDLFDDEVFLGWADDVDAIADVVGMLDEEEDAGAEELLGCGCEDEGE